MIIVTQTYKELELASSFLAAWSAQNSNINIVIANSGYPDETSTLIDQYENVFEVQCTSDDFWTGATRKALQFVEANFPKNQSMIICNIDVRPDNTYNLCKFLKGLPTNSVISLPVRTGEKFFYSGLKRRNFNIIFPKKVTPVQAELKEIDYAPTRFIFLKSYKSNELSGYLPYDIPHYGADFVFTYKLKAGGMRLYTKSYTGLQYDSENTGIKNKIGQVTLRELFHSIKSAHHLRYKYRTYTALGYSSTLVLISILFYSFFLVFVWFMQKCYFMLRGG